MTVVQPNSIAGINSISVQSGQSLSIHKSDGTLIREIVASTGISTFSSISVGSAATANNAGKSINIGLGASISQHADNTLSFGTNGIVRARITSAGNIGVGNDASFPIYTDSGDKNFILGSGSDDAAIQLHSGTDKFGGLYFGDATSGGARYQGYVEYKHDDDYLRFAAGGTEKLRIDTNGNLGVNCTSPTNITNSRGITIQGASGTPAGFINFMDSADNSDARILADNGVLTITADASDNTGSSAIAFNVDALEKLRIGDGYAGTVDVKGIPAHLRLYSVRDTSDWDSTDPIGKLDFYVGDDTTNNLPYNAGFIHCLNETDNAGEPSGALLFGTTTANASGGAVERLRISSSGLVGINTTAPTALLSFGVQRSVQTYPPICFQTAHGSGLADAAISTTDDSGGTDIMMGANVYMGQNGTFTRYFSSYGSAAVRCGYTGNTMFYNKSGNNAPAEAMRINGSGNVKLGGHSTDRDLGGLSVQRLHIEGTDGGSSSMSLVNNQNSTGSAALYMSKSRGTSLNSNTVLQLNDPMGGIVFCGSDGNDMISQGAQIAAHVDGTPGSNDMPGRLTFSTTADGAATVTDRVRINHKGFQGPLPRTGTWQGTIVYKQQSQGANYEHKIRGPLSGLLDTEMDSNFVAYIKVQTIGTGTDNAYCYYSLSQDGENLGATLTHLGGNSSGSSNKPYMVLDGQHACWKTAHATQYNFVVRVEITGGNEEQTYTATGSYAAN